MKRLFFLTALAISSVAHACDSAQTSNIDELTRSLKELRAQHKREIAELRALTTALAEEVDFLHSQVKDQD